MTCPDVTVVVCTYNRAELLRRALGSLAVLETAGKFTYEVLVVNNGSSDSTNAVTDEVARYAPVAVRRVDEPRSGIAFSRNCGIAAARGEWIAFFDDDQLADPRWLLELLTLAREKGARSAAGARTLLLPDGKQPPLPPLCRLLLGEDCGGEVSQHRYGSKAAPNTGNFLIHRTVFDEAGTFDEALAMSGEDSYLYYKMQQAGINVWYTPAALVQHVIPAHRLQDDYFRWTCLRHGWIMARVYWREFGLLVRLLVFTARLGQAVAVFAPRLLWARVRRNEEQALATRCRLWRAEGYFRGTLRYAAPRWFAQEALVAQLAFRNEQQQFASQGAAR
ncbi:MAG: glycosyltransferase family 2 protein [Thermoguttaceae bacterium]|jgi:glycosyltransferase involved in cell wall biosynthesis